MTSRSRPTWLPVAGLIVLIPAFAALGLWQLERAEGKRLLQQEYDRRASEAPRQITSAPQPAEELRFRHVLARGVYDPRYQIFLDNRLYHGVAGFHVITPFKLESSDMRVLVNRGWVALGASRERLPDADAPLDTHEISGVATVPAEKGFTLGDPEPRDRGWQPLWQRLDMKRYAAEVPFAVQPIVVLLDANAAGGFTREWARLDSGVAMHQGYAVQWFALAALAVAILVWLWRRKRLRTRVTA